MLGFLEISAQDAHSSAFILEAGETNKTKIESDVATNFPNLKSITRSNFRKKWDPRRLAFPMYLCVEIRNLFKPVKHLAFVDFNLYFFVLIHPIKRYC